MGGAIKWLAKTASAHKLNGNIDQYMSKPHWCSIIIRNRPSGWVEWSLRDRNSGASVGGWTKARTKSEARTAAQEAAKAVGNKPFKVSMRDAVRKSLVETRGRRGWKTSLKIGNGKAMEYGREK